VLEQQLMTGNMAVLNERSVRTVEADVSSWNADQYLNQQKEEASIAKSFGIGNAAKALNKPTQTQNRKHQLSSLAARAAQTELAMLDARGRANKSKSETQSKYGW
jgi:hypothetical protein